MSEYSEYDLIKIWKKYPGKNGPPEKKNPKDIPIEGSLVWVKVLLPGSASLISWIRGEVLDPTKYTLTPQPSVKFYVIFEETNSIHGVFKDEDWKHLDPLGKHLPSRTSEKDDEVPEWWIKEIEEKEKLKKRINVQKTLIKKQKNELKSLASVQQIERECYQCDVEDAEDEICSLRQDIEKLDVDGREVIGSLLRFEYLVEQVKKINGFRDDAESIVDCFDDIKMPEIDIYIREEFVPTEITDTVDSTSIVEDREYYGVNFDGQVSEEQVMTTSDEELDILSPRISIGREEHEVEHRRITIASHHRRRQVEGVEEDERPVSPTETETTVDSILQDIHDMYDLRETSQGNLVPRRLFFGETAESQSILMQPSTDRPWYEERYPTPLEVEAALTIQRHLRND